MKSFARACVSIGIALALSMAAHAAYAIEYDDVIGLTKQGVSDRTIVELIVKDGRAFQMSSDERNTLRDDGVSEIVIRAMDDPRIGQDWLDGKYTLPGDAGDAYGDGTDSGGETGNGEPEPQAVQDEDGISSGGGYSSSLDDAYGNGYSDGGNTALVYSFGYYYGPLASYYYCDPYYYPFWDRGYASTYWPSYYAFYWRPRYDWCYSYPYNYYDYNSFYCHTFFDAGYYAHNGYQVRAGFHRSVWDNGPRWRNGGLPPAGGTGAGTRGRALNGRFADSGGLGIGRPSAPPVIQQATALRMPGRDRMQNGTPVSRTPISRTPSDGGVQAVRGADRGFDRGISRGAQGGVDRGTVTNDRPRRMSGIGNILRQPAPRSQPDVSRSGDRIPRVYRGGWGDRSTRGGYGYGAGRAQSGGSAPARGGSSRGNGNSGGGGQRSRGGNSGHSGGNRDGGKASSSGSHERDGGGGGHERSR